MASCRSRRLAPASRFSVAKACRIECGDRLAARSAGSPAARPRRRSRARTSARYIRAPVPVANRTRRRAAAAVLPGTAGQRGHVVPAGQVGVDPAGGRGGQGQGLDLAALAAHPQHPVAAVGAQVLDVRAEQLGDPRPGIEERGDQRGGPGGLRAGVGVGGLEQGDGLVPGQARGGRGVVVDGRPGQAGHRVGADVAAAQRTRRRTRTRRSACAPRCCPSPRRPPGAGPTSPRRSRPPRAAARRARRASRPTGPGPSGRRPGCAGCAWWRATRRRARRPGRPRRPGPGCASSAAMRRGYSIRANME